MLTFFVLFLVLLGVMLIASCIYVSPLIARGAKHTDAAPVVITPRLPRAICIPAAYRKAHKDVWG